VHGHTSPLLYEPIINIPLLISAPGQTARKDVYSPSVNIDVLPTLLEIAGLDIPEWSEGQVLPVSEDQESQPRSIFSVEAKTNVAFAPLRTTTIAMRKHAFKLIAYLGYQGFDQAFELYDIENDPEELNDLASGNPTEFTQMKAELLDSLAEANRPFEKTDDPAT